MKIWKIAGVTIVVVLALSMLGVGMVFAQTVGSKAGTTTWGNMMGGMMRRAVGLQGTSTPWTGMMGGAGSMMGTNGMHTQVLTDLAKTLNLTLTDLQNQLKSGKTLTQIALAQGVSQAQLETALETSVKDSLAKAVAVGKLTQEQADQMLSYMTGNYGQMLDMMGSGMMTGGAGGCHGTGTPTGTNA